MNEVNQSMEAFLLGQAIAALYSVQTYLIQGEHKEALTAVNDATRVLNAQIDKHFYKDRMPAPKAGETTNEPA
jgi:hypothetical protein